MYNPLFSWEYVGAMSTYRYHPLCDRKEVEVKKPAILFFHSNAGGKAWGFFSDLRKGSVSESYIYITIYIYYNIYICIYIYII
jgi:hypothetical protein